jgi:sodium/potassium-transporting ATPase subunit alpha
MYIIECSIGTENISATSTLDEMMQRYREAKGNNSIEQLRFVTSLYNLGDFDAATINLPLHNCKINGDATDQAILRFLESLRLVLELRSLWRKNFELAFNSKNKFMIKTLSLVKEDGLNHAFSNANATTFTSKDMYVFYLTD